VRDLSPRFCAAPQDGLDRVLSTDLGTKRIDEVGVAELLGDSKRIAADHYVYALTDYWEVDRSIALARASLDR